MVKFANIGSCFFLLVYYVLVWSIFSAKTSQQQPFSRSIPLMMQKNLGSASYHNNIYYTFFAVVFVLADDLMVIFLSSFLICNAYNQRYIYFCKWGFRGAVFANKKVIGKYICKTSIWSFFVLCHFFFHFIPLLFVSTHFFSSATQFRFSLTEGERKQ